MTITLHKGDLPPEINIGDSVAVDSETMGLRPERDRLCLIQLSMGDGDAHLIQFEKNLYQAPNLKSVLTNPYITKIFHYARFDVAVIQAYLGVTTTPIYCTKIASKLTRTYTDKHGLKDLCRELLDIDLSKQQQSSDWGTNTLSDAQQIYAASDVLHLHKIKGILDRRLAREGRTVLADACFKFLQTRAQLDLIGYGNEDIFSH